MLYLYIYYFLQIFIHDIKHLKSLKYLHYNTHMLTYIFNFLLYKTINLAINHFIKTIPPNYLSTTKKISPYMTYFMLSFYFYFLLSYS